MSSTMSSRELVPFCGLHKTGGIEVPASSAPAAMQHDYNEDMPELYMSQSTTSTQHAFYGSSSQPASNKKRGYEDEAEDDMDSFFHEGDAISEELDAMRPTARIKSSSTRKPGSDHLHIVGDDDFEEAPFLVPMDVEEEY